MRLTAQKQDPPSLSPRCTPNAESAVPLEPLACLGVEMCMSVHGETFDPAFVRVYAERVCCLRVFGGRLIHFSPGFRRV